MCGICGITKNNQDEINKLNSTLVHRGPDGSSTYTKEGISLGHRRLAIIDLSDNAQQPMHSSDGRYVLVFNGEIYNYKSLKEEIGDRYNFSNDSDSEVLLAAYSIWGKGVLKKLCGIFAFAIWDNKDHKLFLCRDNMGVKPLYYRIENNVLSFSSELQSFCNTGSRQIDKQGLALFFGLNYIPAGKTLISNVSKLPAGHYLEYQDSDVNIIEYSDLFSGDGVKSSNDDIYKTIDAAVKRQLVSDRPIGIFLSGGIDSSVVLHHATQHISDIKTFSVAFEMTADSESESDKFNADSALAKKTAEYYGANHKTYKIKIDDVRDNLEKVIQAMDEPVANPTAISQYLLAKWVREDGIVVALGGDGGDELFGGYTRHRAMMASYYYHLLPKIVRGLLNYVHSIFKKLDRKPGLSMHSSLMINKESDIERILKQDLTVQNSAMEELSTYYEKAPKDLHPLNQFMRIDRRTWLAEESLLRSDRSSMAHGVELRVPLLDMDVVRLSDTISPFAKTTPWTGKKILRDTYKNHLPSYLYNQPKRGWISPGAKWVRDPVIKKFCQEVFSSNYYDGLDALINWEEARNMLEDHVEKKGYYLQPLWNLLVLQIWSKRYKVML